MDLRRRISMACNWVMARSHRHDHGRGFPSIDADVVEHFRATGPGWQTRINDTLRRAAKLRKAG
jgi:uncharacterized protein (DUF4415 family)